MSSTHTAQIPILIQVGGTESELIATVRFTYVPAEAETGPSYACGGTPGSPEGVEDREVIAIRFDQQAADCPPLAIPEWLSDMIAENVDDADLLAEVPTGPDPDEARDRAYDDREA